jgi:hypothetical protein
MGGRGVGQADASRKIGGAQMLAEGGHAVLDSCSVAEDGGSSEDAEEARLENALQNAGKWWLAATQSLALRNNSFRSATPDQGLLNVPGSSLQLMIRGCTFENVRIGVADGVTARPIGVVDSTFMPALDPSVPTVQPTSASGSCAVELAGEQICDARALCEGVSSGGVRCSCVGSGLRYTPDVPEDGRQCAQDTSVRAVLETESLIIAVVKPSNLTNSTMTLIVEARGEAALAVALHVVVTRFNASSGELIATNRSIHINQPSISVFGQHIEWKRRPPAATWHADLDGGRFKFADTLRHEFRLRIACDRAEQSCAADGDIITTVVELRSPQNDRLTSRATFRTMVNALASCDNSKTWVVYGSDGVLKSTSSSTAIYVHLKAYDVDMLPISYNRAPVEFRLDALLLPQQWNLGSNEYVTEVSAAGAPGEHVLRVVLRQGWDNATQMQRDCILLEQQIVLTDPMKDMGIQYAVVIGVVAGVVAFVLACCCICVKKQSSARCLIAVVPGIALQPRTWLWRK